MDAATTDGSASSPSFTFFVRLTCCADPNAGDVGNNQALTTCLQTSATPDLPTTYLQHTPIYVNSSNARVPLTIPYPAFSEICVDTYAVGFLDAVPASPKVGN